MIPALLFVLVWLLGYEGVPFAHQAMHAHLGAHSHASEAHCHGTFCHGDDEAQRHGPASPDEHGQGSLEHRGVAALAHEITIFVPELMLAGEQPLDAVHVARVSSFERCSPPARGPPV